MSLTFERNPFHVKQEFCFTSGNFRVGNCNCRPVDILFNCRRVDIDHSNAAIFAPDKTLQAFPFFWRGARPATHSPALVASVSIMAIFCISS